MSAPVSIPRRGSGMRGARAGAGVSTSPTNAAGSPGSNAGSSYGTYMSSSANTPSPLRNMAAAPLPTADEAIPGVSTSPQQRMGMGGRRASLMSSALAASEHTVVNVGGPDEPPRLITCVRSSQGFDWNQEIFLPSHYDHLITQNLERKRDPVHDIVLTDEEMHGILPQ